MKINGNDYNFRRVVYLTICRNGYDPSIKMYSDGDKEGGVTLVYDPSTNPQWATRIDFWVKKIGYSTSGNTAFTTAKIDIYNMGTALRQFINAYNAYSESTGLWAGQAIKKYSCCLKVGYKDGSLKTIFTGYIGSYNVERIQDAANVDTVWHLYAQYPSAGERLVGSDNIATNGTDYKELAKQWVQQTFVSGEDYLKAAVMARPREVSALVAIPNLPEEDTFSIINQQSPIPNQTKLAALPSIREITNENFDTFFQIKYQHFRTGEEYQDLKAKWQERKPMTAWNMDYDYLPEALEEIARAKNSHAYLDLNEDTGMQTIYIYPADEKPYASQNKISPADYVIEDFKNLRRQPGVAGNRLQLDIMMEPGAKPGDSFELTISKGFKKKYKDNYSFAVNIPESTATASTVFAGANFYGMHDVIKESEKNNAIKLTGNIFNTKYIVLSVIHQGSTHSAEWSSEIDCSSIVLNDGSEYTE